MERGANTFPFHNLLPYSESNEGLFLFFSPSLNMIKEKSVATLAIRTFAIQKPTKSVHRITPRTLNFGVRSHNFALLLRTFLNALPSFLPKQLITKFDLAGFL